jgi:hypothetical protein
MKKRHLLSVAVLFSSMLGFAQNSLSMDDVKIAPGQTAQVSVNLNNSTAYTAFQFDMTLPEGITVEDVTLAERASGHTLKKGPVNGKYRVLAYSYNEETKEGNKPITGTEGAIVNLTLKAGETIAENATIVIDAGNQSQDGGQVFVEADGTTNYSMGEVTAAVTAPTDAVITIGESGKTTYVCSSGLDFTDNDAKAYVVTGIEGNNLWLTRVFQVPANTPIVVKGSEGDHNIPMADVKGIYYQSFLIGNNTDAPVNVTPEGTDKFIYLGKNGFSNFKGARDVGAHKAYIRAKALPESKTGSSVPLTISGKCTSICADVDLDFSEADVKAYIATGYDGSIWLTRVMTASAGTPLYVKGPVGTYDIPSAATQTVYASMLLGNNSDNPLTINETDGDYTNHFIGKQGFSKFSGTKDIGAHKSYLQVLTSYLTPASTRGIADGIDEIVTEVLYEPIMSLGGFDDDETTGISRVASEVDNDVWYNLKGQRVDTPTRKGLYIKNGKKVVVK